jgi:hypothetical protein
MNETLTDLAAECRLSDEANEALRLSFGLACASRVRHLLEDPRALAGLDVLRDYVAGGVDRAVLQSAAAELKDVANRHRGSNSIDGSAHAAVSATYAVANALAGRALEAAGYAAYATVYAYGGYAVNDPSAFAPEHAWQVAELGRLLLRNTDGAGSPP